MYLTAHLVRSPAGLEGVNAFRHWHGKNFAWPKEAAALPDTEPGELDDEATVASVKPGGNRVRAYLDVLAPDGTPGESIKTALITLVADLDERRNPTVFMLANVTIRFGVEIALEPARRAHLQQLAGHVAKLVP